MISKALNSIPRPILIKLSYWVRPILAILLKGKKYTDPIDGKSYRKFYLMDMKEYVRMCWHPELYLWKDIVYFGCI